MDNKHSEKFLALALNTTLYRRKKGLTQEQLAELVGISRTHMSNIEAVNVKKSLSIEVLFSIMDALEVTYDMLFEPR